MYYYYVVVQIKQSYNIIRLIDLMIFALFYIVISLSQTQYTINRT